MHARSQLIALLTLFVAAVASFISVNSPSAPLKAQASPDIVATGNSASSEAIANGLVWLSDHQAKKGYWSPDYFRSDSTRVAEGVKVAGSLNDAGGRGPHGDGGLPDAGWSTTALATLALLRSGSSASDGPFAGNIKRARDWMIATQTKSGSYGPMSHGVSTYNQAFALITLAELQQKEKDQSTSNSLTKGGKHLLSLQQTSGGWGDFGSSDANSVATSWCMIALQSVGNAGVQIIGVEDALKRADAWLAKQVGEGTEGEQLFVYRQGAEASDGQSLPFSTYNTATASGALARVVFGSVRSGRRSVITQCEHLVGQIPAERSVFKFDAHHFFVGSWLASLMTSNQANAWAEKAEKLIDFQRGMHPSDKDLVETHMGRRAFDEYGSWDPGNVWAVEGGRVASTAFATLGLMHLAGVRGESLSFVLKGSDQDPDVLKTRVQWPSAHSSSEDAAIKAFWEVLEKESNSLRDLEFDHYGVGLDGTYQKLGSVSFQEISRVSDWKRIAKSNEGEIAVRVLFTSNEGKTERIVLDPMRCQEYSQKGGLSWSARHSDFKTLYKADELNIPADPRAPWYQIVFDWLEALPSHKKSAEHYLGAAAWRCRYYSNHPAMYPGDASASTWYGNSDDILYEAYYEGYLKSTEIQPYVAYFHKDKRFENDSGVQFFVDSYLLADQRATRTAFKDKPDAIVSALDKDWHAMIELNGPDAATRVVKKTKRQERRAAIRARAAEAMVANANRWLSER